MWQLPRRSQELLNKGTATSVLVMKGRGVVSFSYSLPGCSAERTKMQLKAQVKQPRQYSFIYLSCVCVFKNNLLISRERERKRERILNVRVHLVTASCSPPTGDWANLLVHRTLSQLSNTEQGYWSVFCRAPTMSATVLGPSNTKVSETNKVPAPGNLSV